MKPHVSDLQRPLDWQRNGAPNIRSLVRLKKDWYSANHFTFWENWRVNTFDLRTAAPFGLLVWSYILEVPAQAFVLFPGDIFFGFGQYRQNFHNVPSPAPDHGSIEGGNFIGGSGSTILTLEEARAALRMRYYALISNGSVSMLNRALRGVFGVNAQGRSNVFVRDNYNMTMTYIHRNVWSTAFIEAVTTYDMLPRVAGVEYNITTA